MHSKSLPLEVVQQVVAKTDGVPLFVVQCYITPVQLLREENNQTIAFAMRRGGII